MTTGTRSLTRSQIRPLSQDLQESSLQVLTGILMQILLKQTLLHRPCPPRPLHFQLRLLKRCPRPLQLQLTDYQGERELGQYMGLENGNWLPTDQEVLCLEWAPYATCTGMPTRLTESAKK